MTGQFGRQNFEGIFAASCGEPAEEAGTINWSESYGRRTRRYERVWGRRSRERYQRRMAVGNRKHIERAQPAFGTARPRRRFARKVTSGNDCDAPKYLFARSEDSRRGNQGQPKLCGHE